MYQRDFIYIYVIKHIKFNLINPKHNFCYYIVSNICFGQIIDWSGLITRILTASISRASPVMLLCICVWPLGTEVNPELKVLGWCFGIYIYIYIYVCLCFTIAQSSRTEWNWGRVYFTRSTTNLFWLLIAKQIHSDQISCIV